MQINFGSGNHIVAGATRGKKEGIRISFLPNHGHPCDTPADLRAQIAKPVCDIWFETLAAARLFQDQVNAMCLRMNDYRVENAQVEKPAKGERTCKL